MKKLRFLTFTFLIVINTFTQAQDDDLLIDRYIEISLIETQAQADFLNVIIKMKFAKSVTTVKQAIKELLKRSGYTLDDNYESEKINNFRLPEIHRAIGPIKLKRAIKVLLGNAWDIQVDETTRGIRIVQSIDSSLQVLSPPPDAETILSNVNKPSVLDEIIAVAIKDELLFDALNKILPPGWVVDLDSSLQQKFVTVNSDEFKRSAVIEKILLDVGATSYFYKKLQKLVVRSNTKVIN